ncbi:MAG: sensor domain-containing diguanylate cyclase [Spirochaetia bacterium]|nr:sensor domain-containing diguanylate cyclase [Spirochaetia bacterium]
MQSTESFYTTRLINENYHFTVKHITSNIFRIGIRKTDGEFVYLMNEGPISRKFGVTTEIVYNKSVKEIYGTEMDSIIKPYFKKAFNGEVCNYEMNFGDVIFETFLSPVEKNGEIIEIAGSSIDITEKKKYQKKIEEMNLELKKTIMTDSLTKLYNRRRFDEILSEQLSLASEKKLPFVIIIGDIDNFKRINDEFGHLTGDKVLIELSNLLKQNIPSSGFLARW